MIKLELAWGARNDVDHLLNEEKSCKKNNDSLNFQQIKDSNKKAGNQKSRFNIQNRIVV